jgi:hypothetical protein
LKLARAVFTDPELPKARAQVPSQRGERAVRMRNSDHSRTADEPRFARQPGRRDDLEKEKPGEKNPPGFR